MKQGIFILAAMLMVLVACNSNKQMNDDLDTKVAFNNRLMVTMKPKVTAADLENEYQQYKLKSKGLASRSANKELFEFDDSLISNAKMMKLLNKNRNVIKAERLLDASNKTTTGISGKKGTVDPTK